MKRFLLKKSTLQKGGSGIKLFSAFSIHDDDHDVMKIYELEVGHKFRFYLNTETT